MGLDFKIEGYAARLPCLPYSAFNNFRRRLARSIGLDPNLILWVPHRDPMPPIEQEQAEVAKAKAHPLGTLLMHSDCDGELSVVECATLIAPLREVCKTWNGGPDAEQDRDFGIDLAEAMLAAVRLGKPLEFC